VIIRADDTPETLMEKVEVATILGTLQATMTNFGFVSEAWARNTQDEALLGVSLTGIMDNEMMVGGSPDADKQLVILLNTMRDHARNVNIEWAEKLGINKSTAITCVKPSGTVSQLCNTASGIHARHNRNYIRTVRVDKKDPLYSFMKDKGFVIEDDVMRPESTAVVSFAMTAPENAVTRDQVTARQALDLWLLYQSEWCEHKPSVTVTVRDEEWMGVGAWVYEHFDEVSGISFLPHSDHTYQQAPYQDMTPEEFAQWQQEHPTPEVDWRELSVYEKTDNTVAMQTLACTGNSCELP
jgi:ribonucleoside-diphosphate reductase alpha chain